MAEPAALRSTYAEYLGLEASSRQRHEFVAGAIVAMAGGSIEHGRIIAQLQYLLRVALAGRPSAVLTSDVRVRIRAADRATYPDVVVVCDEIKRDPDDPNAIVNPTVLIEVLSDSTVAFDREEKSADYRRLSSLREHVLVSERERRVEIYRRSAPRRWVLDELIAGERLALTSPDVELAVDDVYRDGLGSIIG